MRRFHRDRVVILGGGFAGLSAALALRADRHDVALIDRRPCFEFLPNIHELLSGVKAPDLLRLPLGALLRRAGHRFLQDSVTSVDGVARSLRTASGTTLRYDALIVALGGGEPTRGVPGVVEHALPFQSVDQCQRIGDRLRRLAASGATRRVVIVGGGLEGVEALGEILRRYRERSLEISLVEARGRLLSDAPAGLDAHVRELCEPHPVEFELGLPVSRVEGGAVVLEGGRTLPSDLTIWTGGPTPPPLLAQSGLAPKGEWAPVDATLRSRSFPEVFVAGDAAGLPTPIPKQGYHALAMGHCAARNVERLRSGDRLSPFQPPARPTLISFGDLSCFLVAQGRALTSSSLAAVKEAVFQLEMARLDTQPGWVRLPRMLARSERAARRLLWPSVSSLEAVARHGRWALLPADAPMRRPRAGAAARS